MTFHTRQKHMKVAIIGAGNMGGAIAAGLAKGKLVQSGDIICTARTQATLDKIKAIDPDIITTNDNAFAAKEADIVILAVKPWLMKEVIEQVKPNLVPDSGQIYISVAAGIPCNDLEEMLESAAIGLTAGVGDVYTNYFTKEDMEASISALDAYYNTTILQNFQEILWKSPIKLYLY